MSSRAIRRLREEREANGLDSVIPEEDDSEEDIDDKNDRASRPTAFAMMLHDDSSDSSSSDSSVDEDKDGGVPGTAESKNGHSIHVASNPVQDAGNPDCEGSKQAGLDPAAANCDEGEEDFDALLEEFKENEEIEPLEKREQEVEKKFQVIVANLDPRDLDVDYVMRTSLLGSNNQDDSLAQPTGRGQRRSRQNFLFGAPRDGWVRPPHYVGGGIGMTTYDREPRDLPWPYQLEQKEDSVGLNGLELRRCFTFIHSDSFRKDCNDYTRVQQSGDVNALVLFVAHHPYVTEALLQLGMILYHTNRSQEGLIFLRRCLWVYECSSLISFAPHLDGNCFMDYDHLENTTYFLALFRLAQVSNITGLPRASFAIARLLLSLDPLRDPTGILLALDHYALASNEVVYDKWLVDLVESQKIRIYHRSDSSKPECQCDLLDLPNWAYSYALALHRISQSKEDSDLYEEKSIKAIQSAISRFPSVLQLLLKENEVDLSGRSFQRDWPSVIDYIYEQSSTLQRLWTENSELDTIERVETCDALNLISRIFAKQSHKLWSSDDVLQWLFNNTKALKSSGTCGWDTLKHLATAVRRYAGTDPADYEGKFQILPAEADPLDPGLLGHAMDVNPNRRRFLQQMPMGRGGENEIQGNGGVNVMARAIFGPPTNVIDPDWPILEILWRSLLPWNRVEGVPRPRR